MYSNPYLVPPQFNPDFDFFQALRGYVRFSIILLFLVTLLLSLLWNLQPWFELEIKPVHKLQDVTTEDLQRGMYDRALQSNVKIVAYVARPGDTLSKIAENHGVGLSTLLRYNGIENPNTLRAGQRLKIPTRL